MSGPLDVLVVGGGPVGTCVAALLVRLRRRAAALRVGLLEPAPPEASSPDPRVLAFSRASEGILDAAGAWQAIAPDAWPYERMRVWYSGIAPSAPEVLQFDAAEVGEPNLGHIIEAQRVTAALRAAFGAAGGQLINGQFSALAAPVSADQPVRVHTSAGEWAAQLIVAADGARSPVRAAFGIDVHARNYEQTAIVARVLPQRPHENTAWQRFVPGGTLALLPLGDGSCSIVWSLPDAAARTLLAAAPEEFEATLLQHSDGALGTLKLVGGRQAFALQRLSAVRYTAPRCALVGDAAHVVHPLAGQGVNLGLQDAASLAQLCRADLASGEYLAAPRTLRAYERWRKGENQLMQLAIDGFNRVLAQGEGPLSQLGRRALSLTNRSRLLKQFFIGHALGERATLTAWGSDPALQRR